jgi:MshEN domain
VAPSTSEPLLAVCPGPWSPGEARRWHVLVPSLPSLGAAGRAEVVGQEPVTDCEVMRIGIATRIAVWTLPLPYNFRSRSRPRWGRAPRSVGWPVSVEENVMNVAELSTTRGAPTTAHGTRPRRHPFLGGLLVKDRLINQTQLEQVLALQRQTEPRPLLGQMLVDQKLITPHELNVVLGKYRREHLLGDILVETNLLTSAQLETALASQRRTGSPLGETLVEMGYISERQLKHALCIQLRIVFVDLDQRSIDPDLTAVISERYARHHRAIPIAKADDRIVLAMDDPTDAEVVAEVRSCTGYRIDVATATADALERALSRLYGDRGSVHPPTVPRSEGTGQDAMEQVMPAAGAPEQAASGAIGRAPAHRRGGERAQPGIALDAIRARMEAIRQLARNWERRVDAVEALLRERLERRSEIERLTGELRQHQAALARTSQELEAKTQVLARLEMAHAALLRDRETLGRSLSDLQERHDALLQDRHFAIERVGAALRRLRP